MTRAERPSQPSWIAAAIAAGERYHVRHKSPLRHNARNLGALAGLLIALLGTLAAGAVTPLVLYVFVAGPIVGALLFALYILVIHEASHGMFVISRSRQRARRWNRALGWAVSLLFATDYDRHWRKGHVTHHQRPLAADDPQQENLETGAALRAVVARMLLIPGYVFLWNPSRRYPSRRWLPLVTVGLWLPLALVAGVAVTWAIPIALLLGFQVLGALNQCKGALEHGGAVGRDENPLLRSRTSLFPLRRVLMPFNISMHFEHHLNPGVPWYELPRYHAALRGIIPRPLQPAIFNTQLREQLAGRLGRIAPIEQRVRGFP